MGYKPKMKQGDSPQLQLDVLFANKVLQVNPKLFALFISSLINFLILSSWFDPNTFFPFENELFHYETPNLIVLQSAGGTSPVEREDEGEIVSPAHKRWKQDCSSCHGQMHPQSSTPVFLWQALKNE